LSIQEVLVALIAVPAFLISLAVTLRAAERFASRLDRIGTRFGFPEALVGLLTALAADGPEISSAVVALAKGANSASVGVLVGASVLNIATMIGVSALVAGSVRLSRESLALEGVVGLLVTFIAAAVLFEALPPVAGALILAALLVPYVAVVIRGPGPLARLGLSERTLAELSRATDEHVRAPALRAHVSARPTREIGLMLLEVVLIVLGSFGMVQAALSLGDRLGIPGALIGVLILAPLTSLPNAATAIRLGRHGRGSALVTEMFNSNTINLAFGLVVPALFVGIASVSAVGKVDLGWLIGMTLLAIVLLARPRGVGRRSGALLVAVYAGFVVTQLVLR
jgi:cation:H+ antiporter